MCHCNALRGEVSLSAWGKDTSSSLFSDGSTLCYATGNTGKRGSISYWLAVISLVLSSTKWFAFKWCLYHSVLYSLAYDCQEWPLENFHQEMWGMMVKGQSTCELSQCGREQIQLWPVLLFAVYVCYFCFKGLVHVCYLLGENTKVIENRHIHSQSY